MTAFNWRVITPNTLRAYTVAVKDYETETGIRVDQADAVSISIWQKVMEARGLAVNTIRARISAVSVVSGVKVALPKRQKVEVIMSLDQIRAFFGVIERDDDRVLMASLLFTGTYVKTISAHFAGLPPTRKLCTQEITRKVKRYARLAGLESDKMNLRTLVRSGRHLLRVHKTDDLVKMLERRPRAAGQQVSWKPLHGIGRRTHIQRA
jgi:hypothetical protein